MAYEPAPFFKKKLARFRQKYKYKFIFKKNLK
jgi:hypothetical protein